MTRNTDRLCKSQDSRRRARINVKVLLILLGVMFVLGVGGVGGHYLRKRMTADEALKAGQAAVAQKDWPEACKQLRRYLSKYPDNVEVLDSYVEANLAVRPRTIKHVGAAIGAYRRLLRHKPGDATICKQLSDLQFNVRNYGDAAYVCRQRLQVAPHDPDAMYCVGRALAAQQKRKEATEILTRLVNNDKSQVAAYSLLSVLAVQEGSISSVESGQRWLDTAVEANPKSVRAYLARAKFLRVLKRDAVGAKQDLEALNQLVMDDPRTLLSAAEEWMEWGEFDLATKYLERIEEIDAAALEAFGIDPDSLAFARLSTAGELALQGDDEVARGEVADQGLSELSDSIRSRFLPKAAKLYLRAGRIADAERCLDEIKGAAEDAATGSKSAGRVVVLSAELASAKQDYYAAINLLLGDSELFSQDPDVLRVLADGFSATNQPGRAREALERFVELSPGDPEPKLRLAKSYRHLDWERTLTYANEAWRLRPTLGAKLLVLEARLMRAKQSSGASDVSQSILGELNTLREQFPTSTGVRVLVAAIMAESGQLEDAIVGLEAGLSVVEEPLAAQMLLVDLYDQSQRPRQAATMCSQVILERKDLASPRLRLAGLQASAEQADLAREIYESAIAELSGDQQRIAAIAFARFLLGQGNPEAAVDLLRKLANKRPTDVQIRLTLLAIPAGRSDAEEAQRIVDEIKMVEGDAGVRWKLEQARLWLGSEDWRLRDGDISSLLEDCLRAAPGWEGAVVAMASLHLALDNPGEAEKVYRLALAHRPNAFGVADRLVALLKRQTRFIEAQTVLDAMPQTSTALNIHRIDLAIGRGEYGQAIQDLELYVVAHPDDASSRIRLGRFIYVVNRDAERAFRLMDEAAALTPDSGEVLFARVSLLRAEGRGDEAIELMNDAVARLASFSVYTLRAMYFKAIGEFARAEKDYRHLTTMEGQEPEGFSLLGGFYFARGRTDEAMQAWRAGLEIQPGHAGLRRALAKGMVTSEDEGLRERGRKLLAELRLEFPNDPEFLRVEAVLSLQLRTAEATADAIEKLERAIEISPTLESAHQLLIQAATQRGDYQRAQSLVSRALASNPASLALKQSRILVEVALENFGIARELARGLIEQYRGNHRLLNKLADLFRRADDLEFAAVCNRAALAASPEDEFANVMRAAILLGEGNPELARSHLEVFVRTEAGSKSVAALLALAGRHTAEGNFGPADELLKRLDELTPGNPKVSVERLRWMASQGRLDDVRSFLEGFEASAREHVPVLMVAGNLLAESNTDDNRRLARQAYSRVRELDALDVSGLLGYAQVSYEMGEVEESIQSLRAVLEIRPADLTALNNLSWILSNDRGPAGLKEAEPLVERAVARYPNDLHILDTCGYVFMKLGRLDDARRHLETCVALSEKEPQTQAKALLHLAQTLVEMKADSGVIRSRLESARKLDEVHKIFSDTERAELRRLFRDQ